MARTGSRKTAAPAADTPVADVPLKGHLDLVTRDRIEGWAYDPALQDGPLLLRILDNDVVLGVVAADQFRSDLAEGGIGNGWHSFRQIVPGGLAPHVRHVIQVQFAANGEDIPNSPRVIEPEPDVAEPAIVLPATADEQGPKRDDATARDYVDIATRNLITGWAYDPLTPDKPVALQILDSGVVLGQVLANRYRADLAEAGIGRGQHAFEFTMPGGLSPTERHVIQVRRAVDGAEFSNSPLVIERVTSLDSALKQALADAIGALPPGEEQGQALHFLAEQADHLLQQRADADGARAERLAFQRFRRRWGPEADGMEGAVNPGKRALVIDEIVPVTGRDAGSQAILSHIRALQRLGYAVSLAAAEQMATDSVDLAAASVSLCSVPFYASVEEVLRRQAGCFDVVYLHRADMAARYLALVRRYSPRARLIYSVADLHHVRLQRQSVVEQRPELLNLSHRIRLAECTAAWSADAVISHSAAEVAMLRQAVPQAKIYQVPWDIPVSPTPASFATRQGVAFIGGYSHTPNVDAAFFLAETVMPLVWKADPTVECWLVGSAMPEAVQRLAGPRIVAMGQVADLAADVLGKIRLTVAPLRYGAGVKGKVLESFAAGIPCVMTPIAAEGIPLPPLLKALVGEDAATLAAHICRLHADQTLNAAAAAAGTAMMQHSFNADIVTQSLQAAIENRQPVAL